MCGIAGLLETCRSIAPATLVERLRAMMRLVEHRGPDDWGMALFVPDGAAAQMPADERTTFVSCENTVLLGHRRLSIIDLSHDARQPMRATDADSWLIFNGEIYNYVELRQELAGGYEFHTQSDSEVILAAYTRWGVGMLERFDGMFAFALWDAREGRLLCARDPLGVKPFYYAWQDGLFAFASETRAVLAGIGTRGRMDRVRTSEFLVLGVTDHDDGTCYEEVKQLPGGHALLLAGGNGAQPEIVRYWTPSLEVDSAADENRPERLYGELRQAVQWQLRSDVPVGSCLSGGLDSGSIAAAVGDLLSPEQRRSYSALTLTTAGFEGDESRLARATAERAGLSWVPVEVTPADVIADIKHMIAVHDQPFSSLSMFGQFSIMKRAAQLGLKVMLDGQGGDEIFLGYERVAQRSLVQWARAGRVGHAIAEWRALQRNASIPMRSSLATNLVLSRPSIFLRRNRSRMKPLIDGGLIEAVRPGIAQDMYGMGEGGVFGLQLRELLRYSLPKLLRFEDRNSMAFAVEARVPLLARNVVDYALRLPLEWRVRDGWTKYALRRAVEPRLPREIVWNPRKRGFEVPQKKWVESIRPWIAEQLDGTPTGFPVNVETALSMIDRGAGTQPFLWRALSVALWMRMNGVAFG